MTLRTAFFTFLVCLGGAFVVTHLPGDQIPRVSWWSGFVGLDKIAHTGLYFMLAGSLANCLRFYVTRNRLIIAAALLLLAVYAAFDEWSQQWSPSRSPDVMDFLADLLGVILGATAFSIWRWLRHAHRQRTSVRPGDPGEEDVNLAGTSPAESDVMPVLPSPASTADTPNQASLQSRQEAPDHRHAASVSLLYAEANDRTVGSRSS